MKFKNWVIQGLGILTTLVSVLLIYLILFKDGRLRTLSPSLLVEFITVIVIAVSTRFFWYTSTENAIRTSKQYLDERKVVSELIESTVTDAKEFDEFIEMENINNYNRYITNRCGNMTVANYKLSLFDKIHWIFCRKDKAWYFTRYLLHVERHANRQHKLSGHSIRSLTQSRDGLTDDRNMATIKKLRFLWTGAVFSFVSMYVTAAIGFEDKIDIDTHRAILKMLMYVTQILLSILQSVIKARSTVTTEDMAYFNRIVSIIESYTAYKEKPYVVEKISYIPKEVNNGSNNEPSQA